MYLLACIVAGMVVGGVGVIFWKGTRYIVGSVARSTQGAFTEPLIIRSWTTDRAGGGFVLSFFILSLHTNVLIRPIGLRYILVVGLSAVGFVLATVPKLAIYVTCAATAAMGAAAVVLGIDCFTTGGLKWASSWRLISPTLRPLLRVFGFAAGNTGSTSSASTACSRSSTASSPSR